MALPAAHASAMQNFCCEAGWWGAGTKPGAHRRAALMAVLFFAVGFARSQAIDEASGAPVDPDLEQATAADGVVQQDPPSRVVRVSVLQGNVSVEPASVNE